jgi:branched-chain amino acid aminotransferase
MGMIPPVDADTVQGLMEEGCAMFAPDAALYLRPMMWACDSAPPASSTSTPSHRLRDLHRDAADARAGGLLAHRLALLPAAPRHGADRGQGRLALRQQRPDHGRGAGARLFQRAVARPDGHVAETASTNVFAVRDGEVFTPVPNGTFLNGITRQRVIGLLRADGVEVVETSLTVADFAAADEIFVTGNIAKVMPVARSRTATCRPARCGGARPRLYWDFAHSF